MSRGGINRVSRTQQKEYQVEKKCFFKKRKDERKYLKSLKAADRKKQRGVDLYLYISICTDQISGRYARDTFISPQKRLSLEG